MEEYEGTYDGIRPAVAGLPGPWLFKVRLANGDIKSVIDTCEELERCIDTLGLKEGDRVKVRDGKTRWSVERLD